MIVYFRNMASELPTHYVFESWTVRYELRFVDIGTVFYAWYFRQLVTFQLPHLLIFF
jgi:hypothetical protein